MDTPAYNPLITAFTSGIISSESTVQVRFAQPFPNSVGKNSPCEKGIMTLQPETAGNAFYIDQQTIEFRPEEGFKQGTAYDVKIKLNKLFPGSDSERSFEFRFFTIDQHLEIELTGFRPYNDYQPDLNNLSGTLKTSDVADPFAIRSVIGAFQEKRQLPVRWIHHKDGKEHEFLIDSIQRGEREGKVEVKYDGTPISSGQKGVQEFIIPALGDFKLIGHKLIQYPEQHIILSFSDPIRKNQYIEGLIRLSNDSDMRFIVEGNTIKAYPNVRQNGSLMLYLEPGIRNTTGKGLKEGQSISIVFEEIEPSVELLGNGVIIPTSDEVLFPFKAVNLRAVDLKVIRLYENNIAQFIQVNQLSGSNELKRSGRLILKKTIDLVADKPILYSQWNTFSLNLTDLIETEPGAIYRIELNFRQSQSMYPCKEQIDPEKASATMEKEDHITEDDLSYWDSNESYYSYWDSYNYEGYKWEDRENPCKPAYYGNRRAVARNVLVSNIGLIAKKGAEEKLHITATDLLQATALANASITVYNFQQQVIATAITNNGGMADIVLKAKPFLVVAELGGQKGYLRLTDGGALSYSMFDVSGAVVQKGIKGFLYGERGVWRPGDSIFMNLVLDDRANPLPTGHPVTFELKDPRGKVVQKNISTVNSTGFYSFHTRTAPDAPTGRYTLTATVGGASFNKGLQVETIKPNRLKIDLSFTGDTIYPSKGAVSTHLYGKWLTGATAGNLSAEIEVLLRPATTSFKGFEDYTFTNPGKIVAQHPKMFWEGSVDNTGHAVFSKQLNISGEAPGMLRAIFTTRLFEKSGDFSIDQRSVICSPFNTYVGIKTPHGTGRNALLTDTTHTVEVATVSPSGKPLTKPHLDVKVYKISWRWWWDASYENLASYMGSSHHTPVYSTTVSTRNGHGSFDFRVNYPEWGNYLLVVSDMGGHSAAEMIYLDWPGWVGRSRKGDPDAASILTFSSDKDVYTVGETAVITIPSSISGRILISLENGTGVLRQKWIETKGAETKFQLKITPEMTPNIYLYASLIQPHRNTDNDLPIRMFGVIPLKVEDPDTRLYPQIEMPGELSPNSTVKLKVSEKYNSTMTYTIAMVDEGLLDLTRFNTPDPWSAFYAREALGVKTWDMFEHVLGAYGGRIDGIYSIGGDTEEQEMGAREANRFPPMVKFIGPFTLTGKSNEHVVQMPNYIGSVRTMVIAGSRGAYGHAEKTTPVKQPLMLLATLPRVLGPGEEVSLPVNVFVMDPAIRNVDLKITTNDMLMAAESNATVNFTQTGDQIVDFMLRTPERTGTGIVKIQATAGIHSAFYEIELAVRSSNPPVTSYITAVLDPLEMLTQELNYVGMERTNDLIMEVSAIPPVDFGRRLRFLMQYPHGCIEQITSAVFPQLFLADVVELNDETMQKTASNVKEGIRKLSSFQLSGGGFSYWPGSVNESSWGTSYAGHFLLEAGEKGYDVPAAMLRNWKSYQRKASRRWSIEGSTNSFEIKQEQILQAYRLFTLALSGDPELGSMNRLRERSDLVPEAKWRLAAAYALAGQKETARELVTSVPILASEYHDSRYTFGSRTRDQAMILEAMILTGMKENGVLLLEKIANDLSSGQWMSTQTTAYSLLAFAKFTGGEKSGNRISFEYGFNGAELQRAETGMPLAQVQFEPGKELMGNIKIKNTSGGILFVRFINTGLPRPGEEQRVDNNLSVHAYYTDMDGNRISPETIRRGTDFKAVYRVSNPGTAGNLDNIALTTIFPSGWEIHNERLFGTTAKTQPFTYQDVRDDRVMTYFSLQPNLSKTFTIRLNAAYKGRYYLPSVKAEEMYNPAVQVVIPGKWIDLSAGY